MNYESVNLVRCTRCDRDVARLATWGWCVGCTKQSLSPRAQIAFEQIREFTPEGGIKTMYWLSDAIRLSVEAAGLALDELLDADLVEWDIETKRLKEKR